MRGILPRDFGGRERQVHMVGGIHMRGMATARLCGGRERQVLLAEPLMRGTGLAYCHVFASGIRDPRVLVRDALVAA